jgi:hypothetical protein
MDSILNEALFEPDTPTSQLYQSITTPSNIHQNITNDWNIDDYFFPLEDEMNLPPSTTDTVENVNTVRNYLKRQLISELLFFD